MRGVWLGYLVCPSSCTPYISVTFFLPPSFLCGLPLPSFPLNSYSLVSISDTTLYLTLTQLLDSIPIHILGLWKVPRAGLRVWLLTHLCPRPDLVVGDYCGACSQFSHCQSLALPYPPTYPLSEALSAARVAWTPQFTAHPELLTSSFFVDATILHPLLLYQSLHMADNMSLYYIWPFALSLRNLIPYWLYDLSSTISSGNYQRALPGHTILFTSESIRVRV